VGVDGGSGTEYRADAAKSGDGSKRGEHATPFSSKPIYVPLDEALRSEVCSFWGLEGEAFPVERLCVAGFHRKDAIRCISLGSPALLNVQSNHGLHVATGGLPVFMRIDDQDSVASAEHVPASPCRWRAAHEAASLLGTHARRRTLRLPAAILHEALTRRSRHALSIAELRELSGGDKCSLERCLNPDGSLEEGGVVVGTAAFVTSDTGVDRIWLSALLSEVDGLLLLAEGDVLRRSAEMLAFWCDEAGHSLV